MAYASYFQLQGSTPNPFSFERETVARVPELSNSSMDVVCVSNPKKRDRATFETDSSASLCLTAEESSKRQRFGNYSVTEVDQVYERVILWLAANSDRLPRTLVELEQAIQFINGLKATVDPECVFYHLVLNGFLCVSDVDSDDNNGANHFPHSRSNGFCSYRNNNNIGSGSNNNGSFYSSMKVDINPYPANFEGSFLIVSPDAGPNSLSGSFRVSQDFVTALNKAVTWLRSSLQLPTTKQGFSTALRTVCVSSIRCPASLIIERLIFRDIVRVSSQGLLIFNNAPRADGQHCPVLQPPAFYTASPLF